MKRFSFLMVLWFGAVQAIAEEPQPVFEDPVTLHTDGEPIAGITYPSPVLIDIDGDKSRELVIGDLRGNLWVSQQGKDDKLSWSERTLLKSAAGDPVRLNNW